MWLSGLGASHWTGGQPKNQNVARPIPSQDAFLGFRPGPQLGACERQPINVSLAHRCSSPFLAPFFPLSLKINKIFKKICFIFKEIVIRYCVVLYMSTQHQNQHHIQFRILPFLAEKRETSLSTSIKTSLITYRKEWNPFQNASVRIKCTNIC